MKKPYERRPRGDAWRRQERGFTLVELMVAMVLGLLVAAAGIAALIIGRQGFSTVDSASQLRESGRYAASAINQAAMVAGFTNAAYGVFATTITPGIRGFSNALVSPAFATLPAGLVHNSRNSGNCGSATGTECLNNSDVLMVNFWGASRNGAADGSMVDCGGIAEPQGTQQAYSIIHVATGRAGEVNAEPALACTYLDPSTQVWVTVPLVQGVESFRVLYGTFGVTAGTCAATPGTPATASITSQDQTPVDTWLTAAQMDGTTGYCANNWSRVRSLRVGLLVRGPVGSAQVSAQQTWQLLQEPLESFFTPGSASSDPYATLTTAADGRLRQQLVFTLQIHNAQ